MRTMGLGMGTVMLAAGVVALSGCGPVDAGESVAAKYQTFAEQIEYVESVQTSGSNVLPFTADVHAQVTLEDGLSPDEVTRVVDELAASELYGSRHYLTATIEYVDGDYSATIPVTEDPDAWVGLITDPDVRAAASEVSVHGAGDSASFGAHARAGFDFLDVADLLQDEVLTHQGSPAPRLILTSADGKFTIVGEPEALAPARQVYEDLQASMPGILAGARVEEGRVTVQLHEPTAPVIAAAVQNASGPHVTVRVTGDAP